MPSAFKLKRDGVIVRTHESKSVLNGVEITIPRSRVGRAGDEFAVLAPSLVTSIEAGELDDVWEVVEEPVPDDSAAANVDLPEPGPEGGQAGEAHEHGLDFADMHPDVLSVLTSNHGLEVNGTGAGGNVLKKDLVAALEGAHEGVFSNQHDHSVDAG